MDNLFTGALFFILGSAFTALLDRSSVLRGHIDDLIRELKSLEEYAVEYWTRDACVEDSKLAAHIRGASFIISAFDDMAAKKFGGYCNEYRKYILDIMDLTGGGDFEVFDRKADFERAIEIKAVTAKIARGLRNAKHFEWRMRRSLEELFYYPKNGD